MQGPNTGGKRTPGVTEKEQERENERADYQKDEASNPERREKQDPQFDPAHIRRSKSRERAIDNSANFAGT